MFDLNTKLGVWLSNLLKGHPQEISLGLHRIRLVAERLALPMENQQVRLDSAVIVVAGCGLLLMVSGISTQTMLQLEVESQFRGRLLSLYGLVLRGGPAIGALLVGTTADWIGLAWPLAIAAALTGLVLWRMQAQIPNNTTQPPGKMPFITAPPSSPA